jgi:hypothetical protein
VKVILRDKGKEPAEKNHAQCLFALKYGYNYNSNPTAFIFCSTCFLKPHNCVCGLWRKFATRTKVAIYMHYHEWRATPIPAPLSQPSPAADKRSSEPY